MTAPPPLTALVIGADAAAEPLLREGLAGLEADVLYALDVSAALKTWHGRALDVVFVCGERPSARDLAAIRGIGPGDPAVILIAPLVEGDAPPVAANVDDVLTSPLEHWRLTPVLRWAVRAGRLRNRVETLEHRLNELEAEIRGYSGQAVEAITALIGAGVPGASERAARVAALALDLTKRFQVPAEFVKDLEIAARLHELGRVAERPGAARSGPDGHSWAQLTQAVLDRIYPLKGAAGLIGDMEENWDGTGSPDHKVQGQIPLRSRILRVAADLVTMLERNKGLTMEQGLDQLNEHAGTRYDPLVLVRLRSLIHDKDQNRPADARVLLPITELRQGMVLSEDLYTSSGLKLAARDTPLTEHTLEAILRRHRAEPIADGAEVWRQAS